MVTVVPDLAADYYLVNFRSLIHFVRQTYAGLLSSNELDYARDFDALGEDAQRLYVRLLCRTRVCYRQSKLCYPEISSIPAASHELEAAGFAAINADRDATTYLQEFTRDELIALSGDKTLGKFRRAEILDAVLDSHVETELIDKLFEADRFISPERLDIFAIYRLCFFGNLNQDLTEFVLRDLGLTRFESYPLDTSHRPIEDREMLERMLQYYRCRDAYDAVDTGSIESLLEIAGALPAGTDHSGTFNDRLQRFESRIARQLERLAAYPQAMALYGRSSQPPSRERRARILANTNEPAKALHLCREILSGPLDDQELVFADQFGRRLAKKLNQAWPPAKRYSPPEDVLLLDRHDRVEEACADYYRGDGDCHYVENTLFNALFGLAFWDVVFAPVRGAFFHPFQSAPVDLYQPAFKVRRVDLIDERLEEIQHTGLCRRLVLKNYKSKMGLQNPFVFWQYVSSELLERALERIPVTHLSAVFRRQLNDLRKHRSGFPDLVLFPGDGDYMLIEVKGPGDKLQSHQLRWMQYFNDHGIPHKLATVSWSVE